MPHVPSPSSETTSPVRPSGRFFISFRDYHYTGTAAGEPLSVFLRRETRLETQPEAPFESAPIRAQGDPLSMQSTLPPTVRPLSLQARSASLVEVTIVWGSGRDACAVETKQFKAGSKIVLGESGDFV